MGEDPFTWRQHRWGAGHRVASVSDEVSNAASDWIRNAYARYSGREAPSEEVVRAALTEDFAFESRRSGVRFPDADADRAPKMIVSNWQTGADGQPRFEVETLAVRGERFVAVAVQVDYGNGMLRENISVFGLDGTLSKIQRQVSFDIDDVEGAIAEVDRMHSESEAG